MSIFYLVKVGHSRCSSLHPHTHNFCKDIFKLLIGPPLVSHNAKLLPLLFCPSIRRLWNFSSIYKKIIKLFICAHEGYRRCWIAFTWVRKEPRAPSPRKNWMCKTNFLNQKNAWKPHKNLQPDVVWLGLLKTWVSASKGQLCRCCKTTQKLICLFEVPYYCWAVDWCRSLQCFPFQSCDVAADP